MIRLHPLMHHLVLRGRYLLEGTVRVHSLHLLGVHVCIFVSDAHLVLVAACSLWASACPTIDCEEVCLCVVSLIGDRLLLLLLPVLGVCLSSIPGRFQLGVSVMIIRILRLLQLLLGVPPGVIDFALVQLDSKVPVVIWRIVDSLTRLALILIIVVVLIVVFVIVLRLHIVRH